MARFLAIDWDQTLLYVVSGTVRDEPESQEEEPELIQLGNSRVYARKGDGHVQGV